MLQWTAARCITYRGCAVCVADQLTKLSPDAATWRGELAQYNLCSTSPPQLLHTIRQLSNPQTYCLLSTAERDRCDKRQRTDRALAVPFFLTAAARCVSLTS
jgi:hypothetical protein